MSNIADRLSLDRRTGSKYLKSNGIWENASTGIPQKAS